MSENDIHALHVRMTSIDGKIDHLTEMFNRAAHGEGFHRCARHSGRLKRIEEGVELCHDRIGTVKKWLFSGLVGMASILANFAWDIIRTSIKH